LQIDDFETFTSEKIRADLSEFGEIEQVNLLEDKSCAFTNFVSAILHRKPWQLHADIELVKDENLKRSQGN
jgi:hypothetical protein